MSFFGELRRRNVVKVGAAYAIVAWLLLQIAVNAFPALQLPAWTVTFVTVLLLIGFPIALILAWAYEVTPEGIKRTEQVPLAESITHVTGQKLNYMVTGLLVLAVGYIAADNYLFTDTALEREASPLGGGTSGSAGDAGARATPVATGTPTPLSATTPGPAAARDVLPNSVAVIPFSNLSPREEDAYFAAGIHDEILNQLVKLSSLTVIARTSVLQYANTQKTIPEIARELNVETVMEGSVRYAEGRVVVTTQLVDAATNAHLWSESYERDFSNIFAIQADIAMNVANSLNAAFSREEQRQIETPPTKSGAAYALYLQILSLGGQQNQFPQIVALADRIIAIDPEFADAHSFKAYAYALRLINTTVGSAGDRAETEALARENADRALALDASNARASSALALVDVYTWRWAEARQSYARGGGGAFYSWFNAWIGQGQTAIGIAERGVDLNPLDSGLQWQLGMVLTYAGQLDAAVAALRRSIELGPTWSSARSWLAWAEIARGNSADALRELEVAEELLGPNRSIINLLDILYGYGRLGRTVEAQRLFNELEGLAATQDLGAGGWAMAYLAIGENEKALEQLELGVERARAKVLDPGFFQLMNLRMNVTNDPVLEQPEFVAVRAELTGD